MDTDITPARAGPPEEYRRDTASCHDTASRTADCEDTDPVPAEGRDPAVSGPHAGHDRYGRFDYRYWRCEACGLETTQDISDGCPRCSTAPRDTEDAPDA